MTEEIKCKKCGELGQYLYQDEFYCLGCLSSIIVEPNIFTEKLESNSNKTINNNLSSLDNNNTKKDEENIDEVNIKLNENELEILMSAIELYHHALLLTKADCEEDYLYDHPLGCVGECSVCCIANKIYQVTEKI